MPTRKPPVLICPPCQAENAYDALTCSTCQQSVILTLGPEYGPPPRVPKRTFHLASLMVIVALVAVCFGIIRQVPGLGIPMLLVLTPAMVRTLQNIHERRTQGHPMTIPQKLEAFIVSMTLIILIGISAAIAFFLTCWVGVIGGTVLEAVVNPNRAGVGPFGSNLAMTVGNILGGLTAILVGIWVGRKVWRYKG